MSKSFNLPTYREFLHHLGQSVAGGAIRDLELSVGLSGKDTALLELDWGGNDRSRKGEKDGRSCEVHLR